MRFAGVLATYGVTFVVNMVAYKFLFELFAVHWEWNSTLSLVVAFAISQGTATVVNFAAQRWIIFRKAGGQGRRQAGSVLALVRAAEIFLAPAVVEVEPFDKAGRVVALDQEEPAKAGKFLRQ